MLESLFPSGLRWCLLQLTAGGGLRRTVQGRPPEERDADDAERIFACEAKKILSEPVLASQWTESVMSRRREMILGRCAAHALMDSCGESQCVVGRDQNGRPLWPAGWRGSLSHSGPFAIAVVAATKDRMRPGVDIEELSRAIGIYEASAEFLGPQDILPHGSISDSSEPELLLAFSAKESVYKAMSDSEQQETLAFPEVVISGWNLEKGTFTFLTPRKRSGCGRFAFFGQDFLVTTALLSC